MGFQVVATAGRGAGADGEGYDTSPGRKTQSSMPSLAWRCAHLVHRAVQQQKSNVQYLMIQVQGLATRKHCHGVMKNKRPYKEGLITFMAVVFFAAGAGAAAERERPEERTSKKERGRDKDQKSFREAVDREEGDT